MLINAFKTWMQNRQNASNLKRHKEHGGFTCKKNPRSAPARLPAHREALGPVGVHSHQLTCTLILREIWKAKYLLTSKKFKLWRMDEEWLWSSFAFEKHVDGGISTPVRRVTLEKWDPGRRRSTCRSSPPGRPTWGLRQARQAAISCISCTLFWGNSAVYSVYSIMDKWFRCAIWKCWFQVSLEKKHVAALYVSNNFLQIE